MNPRGPESVPIAVPSPSQAAGISVSAPGCPGSVSFSRRCALAVGAGLFAILACSRVSAGAAPQVVHLLEIEGLSNEEKVAASALAGLLNRTGPHLLLRGGRAVRWSSLMLEPERAEHGENWDAATKADTTRRFGPSACTEDLWIEYFTKSRRFRFARAPLPKLLQASPQVKGWILYDRLDEDCCPAATLAGLKDSIPVTASLRARLEGTGVHLPVRYDYTAVKTTFAAGADRRLEGHRWAIKKLLPLCGRSGAVSRDRTYGLDAHDTVVDIDQAVQKRWFVYDLDHTATSNRINSTDSDLPDKQLIDQVLGHLEPFSPVVGWGRPSEEAFARSLGRNCAVVLCSGVLNNSFFAALPRTRKEWRQRRPHIAAGYRPADKVYVALMVNEGDTVKEAISLQGMGGWTQPERGTIPINWGTDPLLCTLYPALVDYYYDTMTPNDYFFAGTSGWGYIHPDFVGKSDLAAYATKVGAGARMADLHYIDLWWSATVDHQAFLRTAGLSGMTLWSGEQSVQYSDGGKPVVRSQDYYTFNNGPEAFAKQLIEEAKEVRPPWFIIVYGAFDHATPHRFAELAKRLPRDRFKIVNLDEFFAAAEACRARVEGRVWKPGPGAPKGVRP